jgi:hypothetical protein
LKMVFQLPKKAGRSRQGLPVRAIHNTASTNRRLSLPLRPGSVGLPRQMRFHLRPLGVRQYESVHSKLESRSGSMWNPESQQALEHHRCRELWVIESLRGRPSYKAEPPVMSMGLR